MREKKFDKHIKEEERMNDREKKKERISVRVRINSLCTAGVRHRQAARVLSLPGMETHKESTDHEY